jgi:hypothetical protein
MYLDSSTEEKNCFTHVLQFSCFFLKWAKMLKLLKNFKKILDCAHYPLLNIRFFMLGNRLLSYNKKNPGDSIYLAILYLPMANADLLVHAAKINLTRKREGGISEIKGELLE